MKIERIKKDENPLINSYLMGDICEFRRLIEDGADVNCLDEIKMTLISLIVGNIAKIENEKNNDFFDILLENNVNINYQKDSVFLLYSSMRCDNKYVFKKLINENIDINSSDYADSHPYHNNPIIFHAIKFDEYYYLDLLLNKNLDINSVNISEETILNAFIRNRTNLSHDKSIEIFERLIDLGADVNARGYRSMQAIHCATYMKRKYHLLEFLLNKSNNVQINSRDEDGNTSLIIAARFNNIAACDILLKNGANPGITNPYGHSALSISIEHDDYKMFDLLLKNYAAQQTLDNNNCNILHQLIKDGWEYEQNYDKYYKKIIKKHPSLLFDKNKDGKTPLDLLVKKDKIHPKKEFFDDIVKKLNYSKSNTSNNMSL